ncbi:MAG TPA: hypothetical protein PLI12_05490, partial [Acetobacteraceae bacterium]|nr:hypothetical protein [Acetobacteraceae bacterium]
AVTHVESSSSVISSPDDGGSGAVRLISDIEPTGCVSLIGRGTPNSSVTAPPGSSFRNLDGGVGATFWIKQTGNGNTGWVALA